MKLNKPFLLDNGLEVMINPARGLHSIGVAVGLDYGALNEPLKYSGDASVLQGVLYELDPTFRDRLAAEGIQDGTDIDYQVSTFWFKAPRQKITEACKLFTELLSQKKITENALESEKQDKIQSNLRRSDNPMYAALISLDRIMFKGSRAAIPTAGENSAIERITTSHLEKILRRAYAPDSMVLSIYGSVGFESAFRAVTNTFSALEGKSSVRKMDYEIPVPAPSSVSVKRPGVTQTNLAMGFRFNKTRSMDEEGIADWKTIDSISVLLDDRLFNELRNKRGLIYFCKSQPSSEGYFSSFYIYGGTQPKNLPEVKDLILKEIQKIKDGEFTREDLRRARRELKIRRETDLDNTEKEASELAYLRLTQGDQVFDEADPEGRIDMDRLRKVGGMFDPDKNYFASIEPK